MLKKLIYLLSLVSLIFSEAVSALEKLKKYQIDSNSITVSGISSGAFMAVQLAVAYSSEFSGAASVAGGVFGCAQGQSQTAQDDCMRSPEKINIEQLLKQARRLEQQNKIDALTYLSHQKLYIYSGTLDLTVKPMNSEKLLQFSTNFISPENIKFENTIKSGHGFPTINYGNRCDFGFSPWILKCQYDAAKEILNTFYGPLNPKIDFENNHLIEFDQTVYASSTNQLLKSGWVYVPLACQNQESCRLHIALHGCSMSTDYIQDKFIKNAGYNDWAEANHIIILYPQVGKNFSGNPNGCWDWFGYTGSNYLEKSGAQMQAIHQMINDLKGSISY